MMRLFSEAMRFNADWYSAGVRSFSKLISHSPCMAVSGLFSSCEALLINAFSL